MTDDMQSSFGIVDDGSTDKTIRKVQQFDKALEQAEGSAESLTGSLSKIDKAAPGGRGTSGATTPGDASGSDLGKTAGALKGLAGASSLVGGEAGAATGQLLNFTSVMPDMGDQISKLGQGMTLTTGLIGVGLVAAISAGALAFDAFNSEAEEMTKRINAAKDAQITYNEALDMTSASIEDQIKANEDQIKANERNSQSAQESIDSVFDELGSGNAGFFEVQEVIDVFGGQLDDLSEKTTGLISDNEAYADSLDSVEVAANDASSALLDRVEQLGETRKFEQEALAGSAEDNQRRTESIANERKIIQEQIAEIERSGIASDESQARLEELNSELGALGRQSDILSSSAVKAAESQKTLAAAEEELKASAERSQKAIAAAVSRTNKARSQELKAAAEITEARTEARIDEQKLVSEQMGDLADEREDAHKKELKAEKDFQKTARALEKNQSFLQLIDAQDKNTEEVDERRDTHNDRLEDLQEDLIEEREMLALASAETIKDKRDSLAEVKNRTLEAARDEQRIRNDASREIGKILNNRFRNEAQGYQQMGDIIAQFTEQMKASLAGLLDGGKRSRSSSVRRGDSQLTKQLGMIFN